MYVLAPARQPLPGTELIERYQGRGLGDYVRTGGYFTTPAAAAGYRGMGCGMGCPGVSGFMDGSGFLGTGLFTSSSPSEWGIGEWVVVGLGAYVLLSTVLTTKTAVSAGRRKGRAVRRALAA